MNRPTLLNTKMDCGHVLADLNEQGVCATCIATGGVKADDGKVDFTYLFDFWDALQEIVLVLMFGAKKYARGNFIKVPNARERYSAALLRHLAAWYGGERNDIGPGGSQRHHLAAAGCCLFFLLAMDMRGLFVSSQPDTK